MTFRLRKKYDGFWGVDYHGPEADRFEASCRQWFAEQKAAGNDLMEFRQGRADDWVFYECWNAREPTALAGLVDFLQDQFKLDND